MDTKNVEPSAELLRALLKGKKDLTIRITRTSQLGDGFQAIGLLVGDWEKQKTVSLFFSPDFELIDYEIE